MESAAPERRHAGEVVRETAAPAQPECDDLRAAQAVMTKTGDGLRWIGGEGPGAASWLVHASGQKWKRVGSAKPSNRGATVSNSTVFAKALPDWAV